MAVSGFRLRARLDFSIPSCSPGQRGITPAFGYSAPHPSAEGTSTPMIHALPSAHYEPIRLPTAPGLTFTGLRLISRSRPRDGVSRVAPVLVVCVPSPLPRWSCWVPVALFPSSGSFPCAIARSASTSLFFEACSTFTHITARTLAESLNDPFHRRIQTGPDRRKCIPSGRSQRGIHGSVGTNTAQSPFSNEKWYRVVAGEGLEPPTPGL